jgi:AraC family transcriptional regulator
MAVRRRTQMTPSRIQVLIDEQMAPEPGQTLLSSAYLPWSGLLLEHHRITEHRQFYSALQVPVPHLALVLSGQGEARWRARGYPIMSAWTPGTIVYLDKEYELKSVELLGPPRDHLIIEIDEPKIASFMHGDAEGLHLNLVQHAVGADPQAAALMQAMHAEIEAGCPTGRLYAESLSVALLAHLSCRYAAKSTPAPRCDATRFSHAQLEQLIDYIHENLATQLHLAELARLVDLSVYHLCRRFKQTMGITPYQYIQRLRTERAKALLVVRRKSMSITDIALSTGFGSHSHFTAVFHRVTGMSPREYRRQC